jgi:hypothetical protein
MADQDLHGFEEAFFAAGESLEHQPVAPGTGFHDPPSRFRLTHADVVAARASLGVKLERARRWLHWNGHIVGFRAGIAVFTGAEHALRRATLRAFRPLVAVRHPWLARASVVVLVASAANYAAVALAASGVLPH